MKFNTTLQTNQTNMQPFITFSSNGEVIFIDALCRVHLQFNFYSTGNVLNRNKYFCSFY